MNSDEKNKSCAKNGPEIDLDTLCWLSKLNITEDERSEIKSGLEELLGFFGTLNEIDTTNIEPTAHIIPITNVLRDDTAKNNFERDELLACCADSANGLVYVPKILE